MSKSVLAVEPLADSQHHQSSIQSVRRAMSLLKAFSPQQQELGVSDLSRLTGLHKTTVYRLLVTMAEEGFVQATSNEKYRLGPALIRLGRQVLDSIDLAKQALPHLCRLAEQIGETTMLEIWDDGYALVVATVEGSHLTRVIARVGNRLPAHASSGGKAILAFLPREELEKVVGRGLKEYTPYTLSDPRLLREELANIRVTNVAYDKQENDIGISAISAPVFDDRGRVAAALSIAGPTQRIPMSPNSALVLAVNRVAQDISRELGFDPMESEANWHLLESQQFI